MVSASGITNEFTKEGGVKISFMARNGQWSSVGHVSSIEGRSTWDVLDMQMNEGN